MDDSRSAAGSALVTLRSRIDSHFSNAVQREGREIACAQGCDQCCHVRISVFSVEADRISAELGRIAATAPALRARIRAQADDPAHADRCALLVDGRCSVYDERPIICRSHGVPVAVDRDDGGTDVECCPLNFRNRDPLAGTTLRLTAVNQPLSVMARLWDPDGVGARVELADLARAANA